MNRERSQTMASSEVAQCGEREVITAPSTAGGKRWTSETAQTRRLMSSGVNSGSSDLRRRDDYHSEINGLVQSRQIGDFIQKAKPFIFEDIVRLL